MKSVVPLLLALSACSFSSKLNGSTFGPGSGGSSSSSGGSGTAAMPDLTGKTVAEADALLREQGFTIVAAEEQKDDLCGETEDHVMVAQGTICKQRPMPGAQTAARSLRLTYTIEHERYEGGDQPTPWRRMPDLVGKPLDVARTLLARNQLSLDQHFELRDSTDCAAETVCSTSPPALSRKMLRTRGVLHVGVARPAPPPTDTDAPPTPTPGPGTPPPPPPPAKPDTYF